MTVSEQPAKWWCTTCSAERDISQPRCPNCDGVALQSWPPGAPNTASTAGAVTVTRGPV